MRRGPGAAPRFTLVYTDAQGARREWSPAWQFPHASRPNWIPLSPHRETYTQGLVLPRGATHPHFELRVDVASAAPQLAAYGDWQLFELRVEPLGPVACCGQPGRNLLSLGDLEGLEARDGLPVGVAQWDAQPGNRVELIELRNEPERKHVLRAKPNTTALVAIVPLVAVARGGAYRVGVCARGRGKIDLYVHALSDDRPVPLRVGNAGSTVFELQPGRWQRLSSVWFAEATHIVSAQVVITIMAADSAVEIDAIAFQPLGAD
jgi:hypothetical protein